MPSRAGSYASVSRPPDSHRIRVWFVVAGAVVENQRDSDCVDPSVNVGRAYISGPPAFWSWKSETLGHGMGPQSPWSHQPAFWPDSRIHLEGMSRPATISVPPVVAGWILPGVPSRHQKSGFNASIAASSGSGRSCCERSAHPSMDGIVISWYRGLSIE